MKRSQRIQRRVLPSALFLFAFAALVFLPSSAKAWTSNTRHYHNYHHDNAWDSTDMRRMQSERISAQEEARREEGRKVRREEVAARQAADQKAYLASQQAIRDASRAASNAPRGYFYRKPGSTTTSLPASAVSVQAGGKSYSYNAGVFYMQADAKTHIVVPAPVGAVVDALPEGSQAAMLNGKPSGASYYFGTFFAEKDGKYEVVQPPQGTVVSYVPDGYQETEAGDSLRYKFGGISFSPVIFGQTVVYQVAGTS